MKPTAMQALRSHLHCPENQLFSLWVVSYKQKADGQQVETGTIRGRTNWHACTLKCMYYN